MSQNDPYAKLGGGALDQELFKKQTPLSSADNSNKTITSSMPQTPPTTRKQGNKKVNKSASDDVTTSSPHKCQTKNILTSIAPFQSVLCCGSTTR